MKEDRDKELLKIQLASVTTNHKEVVLFSTFMGSSGTPFCHHSKFYNMASDMH
jgi:hypothetical protein